MGVEAGVGWLTRWFAEIQCTWPVEGSKLTRGRQLASHVESRQGIWLGCSRRWR